MKLQVTLAILIATICTPVLAVVIPVTSGEHTDFTRLVFDIGIDVEYSYVTSDNSVSITVFESDVAFDDLDIYSKITRDRVLQTSHLIGVDESVYRLDLNCDCSADVFTYLEKYIVVDISDAPTEIEIDLAVPDMDEMVKPLVQPIVADYFGGFPSLPEANIVDMNEDALTEVRQNLLSQLATAAEQGLVQFEGVSPMETSEPQILNAELEAGEETIDEPPSELQWKIQTAFDRDVSQRLPLEVSFDICFDESLIDIASWAEGSSFSEEIASVRSNYLEEFDRVNGVKLEKLVQTYLYYGFGIEAATYLQAYGEAIPNNQLLLEVASIVDGASVPEDGIIAQAISCNGLLGLFSIVGSHPSTPGPLGDIDSIIAELAKMPIDLRKIFGNRLAQSLIDRNLLNYGQEVYDVIDRSPGKVDGAYALVQAEILASRGEATESEMIFVQLAKSNSATATDALIRQSEQMFAGGEVPSEEHITDLGRLANELRGTTTGLIVRQLEANFIANVKGEFEALTLLTNERMRDPENYEILTEQGYGIIQKMDPQVHGVENYIQTVQMFEDFISMGKDGDLVKINIADNYTKLGFPNLAQEILANLSAESDSAKIVLANTYLMAGLASEASNLLQNVPTELNPSVFVRTHLALGEFAKALFILKQTNVLLVEPSWYSGNWGDAININAAAEEIHREYLKTNHLTANIENVSNLLPDVILLSEFKNVLTASEFAGDKLESELLLLK